MDMHVNVLSSIHIILSYLIASNLQSVTYLLRIFKQSTNCGFEHRCSQKYYHNLYFKALQNVTMFSLLGYQSNRLFI